jgi:signal transduction histidine kinase
LLDGRDYINVFAEVLGGRKTVTLDFVQAYGGRRFFNVVLAPIGDMGLVLSLHDATSQHELNLAKNEMVSLVSHELRTPLTAIQGYSDMLLKYDLVSDKGRKFLETILEESGRLGKLIQSFLDIAYIESGRKQVVKTEFEVGPMLRDLQSVLDPMASGKNIKMAISDVGINSVRADRTLLYQALINLLTNAVKYSPDGSAIRLAVSIEDGHALFEVADQGHGIAPEDTGRVFDKFFRCANKETLQQSGFGLGLAFVKEVALQHGGEVRVQSQVGKGSTFSMRIPV